MNQLFKMAFRDLGRNRRRTLLSALAVMLGLALLLFMAAVISGEMNGAMDNTIRLQSGDIQVRAASYNIDKMSLDWKYLIASPAQVADQVKSVPGVTGATPRLLASGILTLGQNSRGVQVIGIDPQAAPNQIFRQGLIAGNFITADDREGIMIGKPLADKFHLQAGQQVSLLVNKSDGSVDQQQFTVRGIYSTNTSSYDESTVFMPLAKAQAFTGAQDHASLIFVLLKDHNQADSVAAALQSPAYQVITWHKMNEVIVQTEDLANSFMVIFYLIVLGITATVVTNTLVMSVFERTREIGILSAIGMKARRIMAQFLTEAGLIATAGVIGGVVLAVLLNLYSSRVGFYIGNYGISGMLLGDTIYSNLTVNDVVELSLITYIITLLASLYPAIMAARMEPVEALHAQ
jgi:ABC-type lipoprotein release transport system permease subunit